MLDTGNNTGHVFLSDRIGRVNNVRYDGYRSWKSFGEQIGTERKAVGSGGGGDDSGVCSPPLWRTSPNSSPQHRKNHYQSLSPSSRTQAIARGQRELMEMVSRMPESCYELSMKDLVEQQPMVEVKQESFREEKSVKSEKGVLKKDEKKKVQMMRRRSGSIDDERLLLKMVFPVFLGSKKNPKKKNDSVPNNSKITPKSPVCDGSDKGVDKEWWKKRFSASTETESIGSSRNSASAKSSASSRSSSRSSSTNSRQQGSGGCWSFMRIKKGRRVE